MSIAYICQKVKQTAHKYRTSDPYQLCRDLHISLLLRPMGTKRESCKGFYLLQSRQQVIVINNDLLPELQRIILAHEIGHALLHRKAALKKAFSDFVLFDAASTLEYEANIFAAELLVNDHEILSLLNDDDTDIFAAASFFNLPPELLDFKLRILQHKGYKLASPPLLARSDFLKDV